MKFTRIAMLSCAMFLGSFSSAYAICYPSPAGNAPITGNHYIYSPTSKKTTLFSDPSAVPIGHAFGEIKMIMQSNGRYPNQQAYFTCINGSRVLRAAGIGTPTDGNIYPSNLPGIGWRIIVSNSPYLSTPVSETTYPKDHLYTDSYVKPYRLEVTVILVKTGPTSCTGPFTGTFAQDTMDGQILGEYRF